ARTSASGASNVSRTTFDQRAVRKGRSAARPGSPELQPVGRRPRRRGHEMVQGSMSLAQPRCGRDRAVHEVERVLHGTLQWPAVGEPRSDGRGERAPRAVRGGRVEAWSGEASHRAVAYQDVDDLVPREVAAFHERRPGTELEERTTGALHVGRRAHVAAGENRGLV